MRRTQILLGPHEVAALEAARRKTGASQSELIRRAVIAVYGDHEPSSRTSSARGRFAELSGGMWSSELIAERRAEADRE